ncbi:MAG: AAA family ATPase [Myxococcales bacterium]
MKKSATTTANPFLRRACLVEAGFDRAQHPFNVPAFAGGIDLTFDRNVTFFVGENGSGKSTLLEAIARKAGFPAQGGSRDHSVDAPGEEEGDLASALRLSWLPKVSDGFFMRAESFFNFATYIDQVSSLSRYGGVRLHEQSHGESFLALFTHRFERGIFLLDEPEAALSPQRQLAFLKVIRDLEAAGRAEFIICSHSPILLAYPGATLLSLDGGGIAPIAYQETQHYQVTKQFLDSPERFFKHLFAVDG